jgi:predicted dehydrogenase
MLMAQGQQLMVGFNRRFSPLVIRMQQLLAGRSQPVSAVYMVNAGALPPDHWTQDLRVGGGRIIGEGCHFIDLLRYLVGYPVSGLEARMLGNAPGVDIRQDKMTIQLEFTDGSTGVVHYLANGSKNFPKERVEIFSGGRVLVMDNFKSLRAYGWKGFNKMGLSRQDKGHAAEVDAFISRVAQGGEPLIPWIELEETTLATFTAVERAEQPARPLVT